MEKTHATRPPLYSGSGVISRPSESRSLVMFMVATKDESKRYTEFSPKKRPGQIRRCETVSEMSRKTGRKTDTKAKGVAEGVSWKSLDVLLHVSLGAEQLGGDTRDVILGHGPDVRNDETAFGNEKAWRKVSWTARTQFEQMSAPL